MGVKTASKMFEDFKKTKAYREIIKKNPKYDFIDFIVDLGL